MFPRYKMINRKKYMLSVNMYNIKIIIRKKYVFNKLNKKRTSSNFFKILNMCYKIEK